MGKTGIKKQKPLAGNLMNILIFTIVLTAGYFLFTISYDLRIRIINRSEISDIAGLNGNNAQKFKQFIDEIERRTNWKVEIISGLRTREEQTQLKRENPKNASVNKSRHVLGRAVDINLYQRNLFRFIRLKKSSSRASWLSTGVPEIAKKYGLLWGGTYRTYHDPVHFEIN